MGRKIPGRKHRGVKDPALQRATREESLKQKINAPPLDPDEQETPKSIENLIRLKQLAKTDKIKKRNKSKNKLLSTALYTTKEVKLPGMKRPDKMLPTLTQWQGETDEQFMTRLDEATDFLINEVKFEQQFRVSVKRNSKSGAIVGVEKAEPDELEMIIKKQQEKNNPKKKKKKKKNDAEPLISSKERRKIKTSSKKEEKEKDKEEREMLRDHVRFGEVVHQPPQITARPRKATCDPCNPANRPAMKSNLLLQGLFGNNPDSRKSGKNPKNLSMPAKAKLEEQRNIAVQAYRMLKAQRHKSKL